MSSRKNSDFHLDEGKPRVDLLSPHFLREIGRILDFGATKYGDRNWEDYAADWQWGQLYASCMRHLLAWADREDIDPESGMPHLAHAACNIMMLMTIINADGGVDDRSKLANKERPGIVVASINESEIA